MLPIYRGVKVRHVIPLTSCRIFPVVRHTVTLPRFLNVPDFVYPPSGICFACFLTSTLVPLTPSPQTLTCYMLLVFVLFFSTDFLRINSDIKRQKKKRVANGALPEQNKNHIYITKCIPYSRSNS